MFKNNQTFSLHSDQTQKNSLKKLSKQLNYQLPKRKMLPEALEYFRNLNINRFVLPESTPLNEAIRIYYNEYLELFEENKRLNAEFIEVSNFKKQLGELIIKKKKVDDIGREAESVKRHRRYAFQIRRNFSCPFSGCAKLYGTEGSLTQHVKIKHSEFYKSGEYDQYILPLLCQKQEQLRKKVSSKVCKTKK